MSKSKKGKKSSRNLAIKQLKKHIDEKFLKCPLMDRKQLFIELKEWGESLGENGEIFLEALYQAESTQQTQLEIALDDALNKIEGKEWKSI